MRMKKRESKALVIWTEEGYVVAQGRERFVM
jgi:hypothetical protein